jgi:dipeptidyl aminopeptidase/acylaminoacyl peptidase
MTSQSIVRHPERWSAANPQCSLVDLVTEFQTGQGAHIAYLMGATPWDAWQHYIDASPGYHGTTVQTPTLIFHGTQDFLSLGIMENFFYDILAGGMSDARMLRFLGEPHGLYEDASVRYAAQEQIRWFRKHLN